MVSPMFGNGLEGVPADFVKYFLMVLIALAGAGAGAVAVWARVSKEGRKREVSGGPVEVTGEVKVMPKGRRYSAEFCDSRHTEVERRLEGHDHEITNLWNTLRAENTSIRAEMTQCFKSIERSLGRIEGQLSAKDEHDTGRS